METVNQLTINAYNKEADNYLIQTPAQHLESHKPMLKWIDAALQDLHPGGRVFEIGSATPREANYIRGKGFFVQTSDAAERFVDYLKQQGESAVIFNALTDTAPTNYDLFFANAVVPHFTAEDTLHLLKKLKDALRPGGRIAFSIKLGDGDSWISEKFDTKRFIHYWKVEDIKTLIDDLGFKLTFFDANIAGDLPSHRWANITIEKAPSINV